MPVRRIACAIEQIADWHANLFVEPHIIAFVAVAHQYSTSPACIDVTCSNIVSRRLGKAAEFRLEVSWHNDTAEKAARLRATMQSRPLVELASISLALILTRRVVSLGKMDVTDYGARADYRSRSRRVVVEVSGTEAPTEFERRHREKIAQARDNPFRWAAYVVVCSFSTQHRVRFSHHKIKEADHGKGKN